MLHKCRLLRNISQSCVIIKMTTGRHDADDAFRQIIEVIVHLLLCKHVMRANEKIIGRISVFREHLIENTVERELF